VAALSKPATAVLALIVFGSLIRIAMAAFVGLGSDESYTVAVARTFALSYVDFPPLHAWLVGAWSSLMGSEAAWVVRLPFIALFAGSTWMMFRLTAFLFDARAGLWAALAFNLAPVFALPHASWVLPDGPLIFFMLSSAFVTAKLLFEDPHPSADWRRWLMAGALAGLAMLSKYHGVFLLAGTFALLLSWKPGRRLLATPGPWIGALAALAVFAPVIVWNANHDWTGLFFQTQRLDSPHPEFGRVLTSLAAQAAYLAPWIFIPLAYVWIAALARGPAEPRRWFLAMLASGPIVGFTLANILAPGLPHWPMPGWLFVFPALGAGAAKLALVRPRLMRSAACVAAAMLLVLIAAFGAEARTGWLVAGDSVRYTHNDPTVDLLDWTALQPALSRRGFPNAQAPAIAAVQWMDAGKLNYAMGRKVPVLCLCADPQEFRYLEKLNRFAGKDIIIVGAHRPPSEMARDLDGRFARLETLRPIVLRRAGRPAVELTVMRGIGFEPKGRQ
jgi:4-amino-4-deoxy-L-arabinose transferase-like glycosyltransferase